MEGPDFNVFVGSAAGLLKGINLNNDAVISKNFGKYDTKHEDRGVASINFNDPEEKEILVGLRNQRICNFDTTFNSFTWGHCYDLGNGLLVSAFKKAGKIIAGLDSGEIGILQGKEKVVFNTLPGNYESKHRRKPTLCCVKSNVLHPSEIATGGCENILALWDICNATAPPVFRAKNVNPDMLDLRVPIWISDLTYLPNSNVIACASSHKQVLLYDPKAQRKPVINFEWEDKPLISIAAVPSSERQIVIGSNHGKMALFDLRKAKRTLPVGSFKSFTGAVTGISVHPSLPLVFSVSLDRFLRVHHLYNKNIIYKEFLKSRLTSVLCKKTLREEDFFPVVVAEEVNTDVKISSSKRPKKFKMEFREKSEFKKRKINK